MIAFIGREYRFGGWSCREMLETRRDARPNIVEQSTEGAQIFYLVRKINLRV